MQQKVYVCVQVGSGEQALVNLMERPESTALQLSGFLYQFTSIFQLSLLWLSIGGTQVQTDELLGPLDLSFHPVLSIYCVWGPMLGTHRNIREPEVWGSSACHSGGRGYIWVNINQHSFWSWKKVFKITHTLLFCQQLTVVLWRALKRKLMRSLTG